MDTLLTTTSSTNDTSIPIVDFRGFNNPGPTREKIVADLMDAVTSVGFFYLDNAIDIDLVNRMFDLSAKYFALPKEEKRKIPHLVDTNAGYVDVGVENLNFKQKALDYKEAFDVRKANGLYGDEDRLPTVLRDEKDFFIEFQKACLNLISQLLRAFAIGLQIPTSEGGEDYFVNRHRFDGDSGDNFRLLHYPPLPDNDGGEWTRAGGHSDYGTITLLFQTDVGGLEALIQQPGDTQSAFIPVPPRPGSVVINTGDLLQFWTRGLITSAVHRVVIPKGEGAKKSRYSIAYFCHPDNEVTLDPIPSPLCKDLPDFKDKATDTLAYVGVETFMTDKSITALDYLQLRLKASYL
ncbi:hypothetical protein HK097_005808 [Rhizophlyctis rosea]|uniref:Fe2OG dioxygenase domain-containing protein n=1 Tax=Rhizophlyctis rosea TaxID=64517 RepID=A0AAD5SL06_9FUNG|nr:hypothetical protein HK097_005808 [Rhizophlyctis rosea]